MYSYIAVFKIAVVNIVCANVLMWTHVANFRKPNLLFVIHLNVIHLKY